MSFEEISERLKRAEKVAVVTGAGVSRESGIPTFRGEEGLWRRHDPMKLASIEAFRDNPGLVWQWYEERRANIRSAKPNRGHEALADLERFCKVSVLTQNIDGLHQRAGSTRVLELHGNITRVKCTACSFKDEAAGRFPELPPRCNCGGILRPDVVWFGEPLSVEIWQSAIQEAYACDVMIIAGTSLVVSPANALPAFARRAGAVLVEVNPEETEMSREMNLSVREVSSVALGRLAELMERLRG